MTRVITDLKVRWQFEQGSTGCTTHMSYKLNGVQMAAANGVQMDTQQAMFWLSSPRRNPK